MSNVRPFGTTLQVVPGRPARLANRDPGESFGLDKETAAPLLAAQLDRIRDLQDRLWAEGSRAVLVVLQGIDTAGKDGIINKVMTAFNPQGARSRHSRSRPPRNLRHDYLWRVHNRVRREGRDRESSIGRTTRMSWLSGSTVSSRKVSGPSDTHRSTTSSGCSPRKRHDDRQVLPVDRSRRAARRFQARYDDPTKRWKFRVARP